MIWTFESKHFGHLNDTDLNFQIIDFAMNFHTVTFRGATPSCQDAQEPQGDAHAEDQERPGHAEWQIELGVAHGVGNICVARTDARGWRLFFDVAFLQSLDVIRTAGEADRAAFIADEFMLSTFESFARVYWGLQTRNYIIWTGGVYHCVLFCSTEQPARLGAIDRAQRLQPRVQSLEAELEQPNASEGIIAFGNKFFWRHGIIYRELLMLSTARRHDEAMQYSWGVHGGFSHEKGVEGLFRAYRRITRRGTESAVVSIERLHNAGALAGATEFRNVLQEKITADDLESHSGRGRWDEVRRDVPRLGRDKTSLPMLTYRCPNTSSLRKPADEDPSCVASAHAQQIGCEHALLACPIDEHGDLLDITPLERGWLCQLVHTVSSEAKDCEVPTVLIHVKSSTPFLITSELGYSLLGWPLRVLCSNKMEMGLGGLTNLVPLVVTDACPTRVVVVEVA